MEWVVTTGKSVGEAKEAALDQLGVDEQEAEFEVLEEPRTGLFGRVRGEARVRARILPAKPRPKVDRRDRRSKSRSKNGDGASGGNAGSSSASSASGGGAKERAPKAPKASSGGSSRGAKGTKKAAATTAAAPPDGAAGDVPAPPDQPATPAGDGATREGGGERRSRGGRKRSPRPATAPDDAATEDATPVEAAREDVTATPPADEIDGTETTEGTEMTGNDVTVEEQAELTTTFLRGLVDAFGLEGSIEQQVIDEDTIEVHVLGPDLGLLIGPKGQTLTAVQELSRTYVQRKATGTHFGRVRIDIGGYRARRREALERFTHQVAEQVLASGVQKALEPMVASDRKVVHDTANGIDGVRTISEGEEPRRRVVIAPA